MESLVSGLLHEPLSQEVQNAIFLPWIEGAFGPILPHLRRINEAHVVMLADTGLLSADHAAALLNVVEALAKEGPDAFTLDGSLEDVYFNYEAQVIRRLGQDVGGRLHMARSRNDLQSTLDRMRARQSARDLMAGTLALRRALIERAKIHADCVMPGYTHMQHAQPITYGFYLLGVENGLQRDFARGAQAFAHLNQCPLGAGAMAGTTFAIDRELTAALLGFSGPMPHALDAVASKDAILELLTAALFVSTTFGRMAQDFYTMSTFEFGTLTLPDSLAITSSIMPQKKNQAVLEFVKGRQAHLLGAMVTAFGAFRATPYSHVLDANADSLHWVWQGLDELNLLMPVVRQIVERAEPNVERMLALSGANFATATDLADHLVQSVGLSFKEAHHITGRVVRLALEAQVPIHEIGPELVSRAALEASGRDLTLTRDEISAALDPRKAVARRCHGGGPSAHDMAELLRQSEASLIDDETALQRLVAAQRAADETLDGRVTELRQRAGISKSPGAPGTANA